MISPFSHIGALLLGTFLGIAHAQGMSEAANTVSGGWLNPGLGGGSGAYLLTNLAIFVVQRVSTLVYIAGLYAITRAGIRLVNSQDEDKLTRAKRTIATSTVAIMLAFLTPRIVDSIYGGISVGNPESVGGTVVESPGGVTVGAGILTAELFGVMRWVNVLTGPLAIAMIVIGALRAMATFGKEDSLGSFRRAVAGSLFGIVLLVMTETIKATFGLHDGFPPGNPTAVPLLVRLAYITSAILRLMLMGATAMVVYAGLMMILNWGNDDQYGKAKKLIVRVLVGLAIIAFSLVAVEVVRQLIGG